MIRLRLASLAAVLITLVGPSAAPVLADERPDATAAAPTVRPRDLAVAPEELGPNWAIVPESVEEIDVEHLGRAPRPTDPLALFQARYRNDVDFHPEREAAFLVAEFQDQEQADLAMHEYLNYVIVGNLLPEVRWTWHAEEVNAGDHGYRFGFCFRGNVTAGYLFTNGALLGGVLLRGAEEDEGSLLSEATLIAGRQEALLLPTEASAELR
jgi:hypothetical protein